MLDAFPSVSRLTYTAAEVAHALGVSEPTFREKRGELERLHGFPGKLPGFNKWSAFAVTDWVASNGGTYRPRHTIPNDDPEIDRAIASLEARYGAGPEKAVA